MKRREFLQAAGAAGATLGAAWPRCLLADGQPTDVLVNDVHSKLNATRVQAIRRPVSIDALPDLVRASKKEGRAISIAAARHAMGGQQFGARTILLDLRGLNRVLHFDRKKGEIEVEAGIEWPQLIKYLILAQSGQWPQWGIIQKQTGADRLSIGGALAANVHGRGLLRKPFIDDVISFTLIDADGNVHTCSRRENSELFSLAIGGYGLFGVIARVTLRLMRRLKLRREVKLIHVNELMSAFNDRIDDGFLYGDFQFSTAAGHDEFLRQGVFSCYKPVDDATPMPHDNKILNRDNWRRLYYLAHADRKKGFDEYSRHYLSTSGQLYFSDTHQLSTYVADYHLRVDELLGVKVPGSEMITEIYVPRDDLARFLTDVREDFEQHRTKLMYGTVRLIEKDDQSFLAWATQPYACIIFNLHVDHNDAGRKRAARDFQRLIDRAIRYGGSYYLTYHRWATRKQVETCHPRFVSFLKRKRELDPQDRFQSDWYRHYRAMFADRL